MKTATAEASILAAPALSLRIVSSSDDLRRLAPAWQDLVDASGDPQPMCAPSWLLTWWQIYGRDRQLRVGLFLDGDNLVGVAPLCRRTYWYRPGIPFRRLEFLGSDVDENDGVCSEYLNLTIRRHYEHEVTRAFAAALDRGAFGAWDECVFSAMDRDAEATAMLSRALHSLDARVETTPTGVAPFARLSETWDEYLYRFNKKKRQSLTYALRDFQAWAGPDWGVHVVHTADQVAEGLRILVALHRERWQADGKAGAFDAPRFHRFHEHYTQLAFAERQLLLLWVSVRGAPVAALYGFVAHDRAYFYQCGRTLARPSKVRLGIVMVILAMQEAMRRGLSEFDFLGGEAQYKSLFTSEERPLCQIRAARRGLPEFSRTLARKLLGFGRALRRGRASLFARAPEPNSLSTKTEAST
ncbi:MAG: GNAT family N-acetyltransferase [Gemmataceae bacterium]|nr:GNAT family N-acetyltransferase [Gemmataceae bacterium]